MAWLLVPLVIVVVVYLAGYPRSAAALLAVTSPTLLGPASTLVLVVVVVLLQVGAELFIGRNYAVTVVFVTPLALIMAQLAHPVDEFGMLRDRTLETLLGAAVALAISLTTAHLAPPQKPAAPA